MSSAVFFFSRRVRTGWIGYVAAIGAVTVVSGFIGLVLGQVNLANASMLYLMAVLATAVAFGRGPAVFASILAFLTFDFFFVEPLHQLAIFDPQEWVSLLLFLMTAIVTGQLAAAQRERAREARQREREAVVLYDVVRLIGEQEVEAALPAVAERLREELSLVGVAIDIVDQNEGVIRAAVGSDEAIKVLQGDAPPAATHVLNVRQDRANGHAGTPVRWVRLVPPTPFVGSTPSAWEGVRLVPVRAEDRRVGALLLASPPGSPPFDAAADRLLSAVAAQIGLAVERGRLRREATQTELLRRTDQLRRALLNAVSHDLRTPLASIMASAGSLQQDDVAWTDNERQEFAHAIIEQAERLNRIVGNLLDLSRIEGGELRPDKGWYDMRALVDEVVGRLRPLTGDHRLTVQVADDLPVVSLDYVEVDQVFSNLIENATKYAPAGTEIGVSVHEEHGELRVLVEDRGPGIAAAALPHLFDPFYRVADGRPRPAGLGLGLAVARGLVEAHGGRIWVENRQGGGARFAFTLPLSPAGVPA